jgi:hypothetical protein
MSLELKSMPVRDAIDWLIKSNAAIPPGAKADFAIGVCEEQTMHGLIVMKANGYVCELVHLYTDGTALVGSLLYGAAWRAAKALGYKMITL